MTKAQENLGEIELSVLNIDAFEYDSSKSYKITGVRGTGKTVMLSYISEHFSNKSDWVVVELITESVKIFLTPFLNL